MFYSDNPALDYDRYCDAQDKLLDKLPRCSQCDEPIQEEYAYYINDEWVCEDCMEEHKQRVYADD